MQAYEFFGKKQNCSWVGTEIDRLNYRAEQDYKPAEDLFEPISSPSESYLRLPENIKIEFIDTEERVKLLEELVNSRYIGVDSEWRVQVHKWH